MLHVTEPDVLATALRRAGLAEVDASTRRRAEYSTDASLYRVVPDVVAFPRTTEEVQAAFAVCRDLAVPLTARGAGTSIAGNSIGTGLVLDFSRHLNRIHSVDPDARTAVVDPGVVLSTLQSATAPHRLRFGPDPSTQDRCTLGGMMGNNACGAKALAYGRTADNVLELDVLTGAGQRLTLRPGMDFPALRDVVGRHLATIRTELGRFTRQVSGYSLEHLLPERGFDVPKALVGTEGTCAVILGATVRLVEVPASVRLVVLGYPDMATAADAVPALLPYHPISVEGLDARIVQVVRDRRGPGAVPPLPAGQGWLFVEVSGEVDAGALIADSASLDSLVISDARHAAGLLRIRQDGAGLSARSVGGRQAHAGWEDAAVPVERLGAYLREFEALMAQHGLTGLPYGHFGDGCLHVRIDFPLSRPGGVAVFRDFLTDAATLVAGYGGSMSGEHGDGRARGELLGLMYSPDALAAFGDVKRVFDPDNLLNPGIIVDPRPLDADLRVPAAKPLRTRLAFGFADDGGDFTAAVHRCTGVGKCRADTTASGGVMCPSYVATRDEKDSTRGRARVLQEMANGSLVDGWRSPAVKEVLDLCLSCKGCRSDCPTGVDMATYKAEVLHQSYRRRLRPLSHYSLGWLPRWARLAARAPRLANRVLAIVGQAFGGRALTLGGIDARRSLPRFAQQTFRQWFAQHPAPAGGTPVMLWVDTFTNHFSPEVGIAAVRVLERAGCAVQIPDQELCCGLTWISTGQLDAARRILRRSVDALPKDMPVVGLEPSCTAVFRSDAEELLGETVEVRTLAEHLASVSPQWTLPDVRVVAQPHCHQHAVMGWDADRALLERAGATVDAVGGCCGLAGNFGVERGHYDVSVAIAEHALLPAVRGAGDGTVVLADGFSCRTQLDELAGRRALHLAQLLDASSD